LVEKRRMRASRSVIAGAALLGADGLLSILTWATLGIWFPTVMADLVFAEGSVLLVVGGISGIFTLSPSLNKVKRYFDERYESRTGLKDDGPTATQAEAENVGEAKKPTKLDGTSARMVIWGAALLVMATVLSVAIVLVP